MTCLRRQVDAAGTFCRRHAMKKDQVKIGRLYVAKVSDKLVTVRIDSTHSGGGWNATNTATGKRLRIKSARRLRGVAGGRKKKAETTEATVATDEKAEAANKAATEKVEPKKADGDLPAQAGQKPKRVSALDAAAQVLAKAEKPMRAQELIAAMAEQGLWSSPAGKTPHATLYAAMLREITAKGKEARFTKVDRGLFAVKNAGA